MLYGSKNQVLEVATYIFLACINKKQKFSNIQKLFTPSPVRHEVK